METTTQFDLNIALQSWLQQLGQSPEVKPENLKELEAHVRDSVDQLQTKGLSSEESFWVATHRVGSPAKLGTEFGKMNGSVRGIIIHLLILALFSVGCWFLWAILHLPQMMLVVEREHWGTPAFTSFVVGLRSLLIVPPLLAAAYCVRAWMGRKLSSWVGFFAGTTTFLVLLSLPILAAVLLPVISFMNHASPQMFSN